MAFNHLLTRTAVVTSTVTAADSEGNWTSASATTASYPAYLEPRDVTETVAGREIGLSNFLLILPADADVEGHDTVRVDGVRYEVVGPPKPYHIPSSGLHHIELVLRRAD